MSSSAHRVLLQPAFLLHYRPYRDTSRILELFTRDHGRITLFARGARRAGSALIPVLQPFNSLLVSWSGRGEAGNLMTAELGSEPLLMPPARLMSGFYLNELMMKLFARHDAHEEVFELYAQTLNALKRSDDEGRVLRIFEKRLLQGLGYGLSLDSDITGQAVSAERLYRYSPEQGLVPIDISSVRDEGRGAPIFRGASLLSLAREELDDAAVRNEARQLLRIALERLLDGRALGSREVLNALRRIKAGE